MLGSLLDLAINTARIVTTPVELLVDVANEAIKPVAEVVDTLADDIRSIFD